MNSINTNFASERSYSGRSSAVSYENDGTFASLISKSQKSSENNEKIYDFSDMYVRTHQTSVEEAVKDQSGSWREWANEKYMDVPVAGDLRELMESIEKGLADGESLKSILQNRIDRYHKERGKDGYALAIDCSDNILIDPETGKVIDSAPMGRCVVWSKEIQDLDYDTVRSQADDLATFLRYAVFKKDTDDPEKVNALIAELKKKQSGYDTSRFLPIFSPNGELGEKNLKFWAEFLESGRGNDISEDERNDAADELLKILEERYSADSGTDNDRLEEIIDGMKAENIVKSKITRTALHDAMFRMY